MGEIYPGQNATLYKSLAVAHHKLGNESVPNRYNQRFERRTVRPGACERVCSETAAEPLFCSYKCGPAESYSNGNRR